jgi:hypothetical protein
MELEILALVCYVLIQVGLKSKTQEKQNGDLLLTTLTIYIYFNSFTQNTTA